MDRIDLRIEMPAVTAAGLMLTPPSEGSAELAARVAAARWPTISDVPRVVTGARRANQQKAVQPLLQKYFA